MNLSGLALFENDLESHSTPQTVELVQSCSSSEIQQWNQKAREMDLVREVR